jgi:ADP-heptose:LPS heptosyltransferase
MKTEKKLGIWMDHTSAYIMEFTGNPIETKTIESKFTHEAKERSLHKGENVMHNREQHQQTEYYKKLGELIKNYGEVVLFGPTEAKDELLNVLKADHHFDKIKIIVKHADKMTEHQQHAFVKEYFAGKSALRVK